MAERLIGDEVRWNLNLIEPITSTRLTLTVQVGAVLSGTVITNDQYGVRSDQTPDTVLGSPTAVVVYSNMLPRVYLPLIFK